MSDNRSLVEVSFERTVSKAQYEPERAYAKVSTSFDTDGNEVALVDSKLAALKKSVYVILGLGVSKVVSVDTKQATAEVATTPAETSKGRGRPTKAETEAKAKLAATAALAEVDPLAELEDDKEVKQAIQSGDAREDVLGDLGTEETSELPITDQELQNEAGKAVQRLGDAKVIRAMVKNNYRVATLNDTPANVRRALVSDLRNLQKDGTIKKENK